MCIIEKFTDIYPTETRTRTVIKRCVFSNGKDTCHDTRVHDRGEFCHVEPRAPKRMPSPKYHTIAPPESTTRPRPLTRNISLVRKKVPENSRPSYSFVPSFSQKASSPGERYTRERGRERFPRSFIVDSPEEIEYEYRSPRKSTPPPRIRSVSPRTSAPPPVTRRGRSVSPNVPRRDVRTSQKPREFRRPRERSPSIERIPRRRSGPVHPVEVHNTRPELKSSLSTGHSKGWTKRDGRQVHFSSDIEYADDDERAKRDSGAEFRKSNLARDQFRRKSSEGRASYRQVSQERIPSGRMRPSISERIRHPRRTHDTRDERRERPRIIQDGRREISSAGERIFRGRERQTRGDTRHDFESQSSRRRQNRRSDYSQSSNSGDGRIVYDRDPWRNGSRWP